MQYVDERFAEDTVDRRGSATCKGHRIEPAALWCLDLAARTAVLLSNIQRHVSKDTGQRRQRVFFELVNPTAIVAPHVQYLRGTTTRIRETKAPQDGFIRARNPKENGTL